MRCQLERENGERWFWGGFFYKGVEKLYIDGFNLLNEEKGIPEGKAIVQHEMGFCHDSILIEEEAS